MLNYGERTGFFGGIMIWLVLSGTYAITMMANMFIATVVGACSGWMISCLPFLGRFVVEGFSSIGIAAELHKIGAAAGFLIGATKGQFIVKQ